MKSIDKIYDYVLDQSMYKLSRGVFYNSLFYFAASTMGLHNIRMERKTNRGIKVTIPNFFGITFGVSGIGKDHSFNKIEELFQDMFDRLTNKADGFFFEKQNSDGESDPRYVKLSSYFLPVKSSVEGLQKAAQTLSDMGNGSVNVFESELGNRILAMDGVLDFLKKGWDTGTLEGQLNVGNGGANYFPVKNMSVNALLFGAPGPFIQDPKRQDALVMAYVSGMARRSFIFHDNTFKKSQNKNADFEMMSDEDLSDMSDYLRELKLLINEKPVIELPQDVFRALMDYDDEKQILRERSESPISEDLGAPQKIEKLLPILAILDLSKVVTMEHLEIAKKFTEMMDATAVETVDIKPDYVLIYEMMERRGFLARTDIVRSVKNVSMTNLKDNMILVEEYANQLGNTLIKKTYSKIEKWKVEKLSKSDLKAVLISVNKNPSKHKPDGFLKMQGDFFNIHKLICSNKRYSAGTFKESYIEDANYLEEQNLFIIDVDNGMELADAKNLFSGLTYLIATTKSHQVLKNNVTCDRYRIILPTLSTFHLNVKQYSEMYMNVINSLGIPEADEKCRNASRWYFGVKDAEHWYNEGELLDIRSFIPDSSQKVDADKAIENYENKGETFADDDSRISGAITWFLNSTSEGNRNDQIFLLGALLKGEIQTENWENIINHANSCLTKPIKQGDMKSTIRSLSKRNLSASLKRT